MNARAKGGKSLGYFTVAALPRSEGQLTSFDWRGLVASALPQQKKLIYARHNKLKIVQRNKLIVVQRNRLIIARQKKLTRGTGHGDTARKTGAVFGSPT